MPARQNHYWKKNTFRDNLISLGVLTTTRTFLYSKNIADWFFQKTSLQYQFSLAQHSSLSENLKLPKPIFSASSFPECNAPITSGQHFALSLPYSRTWVPGGGGRLIFIESAPIDIIGVALECPLPLGESNHSPNSSQVADNGLWFDSNCIITSITITGIGAPHPNGPMGGVLTMGGGIVCAVWAKKSKECGKFFSYHGEGWRWRILLATEQK